MTCRRLSSVALVATLALLSRADLLRAQRVDSAAVFRGRVVQQASGAPVVGADVWLTVGDRHVVTDSTGAFRFDSVRVGTQLIQVRRIGFDVWRDTVVLAASHENVRTYALVASAAMLDTVRTQVATRKYISPALQGFEERMNSHEGGTFIGDSVLRQNESRRLPEVMASRLSGVTFFRSVLAPGGENPDAVWAYSTRSGSSSSCGAFQKCVKPGGGAPDYCYVSVYVDNVLIYDRVRMPGAVPPDLSMYYTTDVAGVEFYPGGASIPAQFSQNSCGVLAIYTREK